jgi:membrane protease YdiL (CAAX protease family)
MIPETTAERRWFRAVSVSAGIGEELFYRGFLMWYLATYVGTGVAVVGTSALFGFDHLYLGRSHVLRTAIVGAAFAGIVLLAQSLWPAMLIHTLVDLVSGDLGERALRHDRRAVPAERPLFAS